MFISKLTIQISSLYFMIILLTNTLLCGEVLENTQNEQIHNNNVNNNRTQSPNRNLYSYFLRGLYNRVTGPVFSFFRKTKEGVWYLKNKIKKDKPVGQTNHNPLKRVQEPLIAHRDNGFFLAEGIILYFLEFFCQNNFYIQDTDTQIIQKLTEKFKLFNFKRENNEEKKDEKEKKDDKNKKDNTGVVNDATTNSTTTDTNNSTTTDANNSTTTDNNSTLTNNNMTNTTTTNNNTTNTTNNTTSTNITPDTVPQKSFPSGIHLLTECCFENGFLKCKDSDHTKEIFDLIFADDDQISKLISIDEKILKNVITYKKMLTISENNKIVEFLNLLLKNKPNDTIDRINKNNRNGYNLIYPKCDSAFSLVVCFLKGVFEKIKMNYEENEKRYKQGDDRKEGGGQNSVEQNSGGQGLLGQNSGGQNNVGQNVTGQGTPVHNNLGQGNLGQNTLSQTKSDQTLTNNYELPLVDNQNDSFRELAIF